MFKYLATLFIIIPALEIYILFKFGSIFGPFNTFLIIITTGILGAALAKKEGLAVINSIQGDISNNKLPANELISALLVFGGGLLLLTPGFVTDLLGLSMIFPITRLFYIALFKDLFKKRVLSGNIHVFSSTGASPQESNNHKEKLDNILEADFKRKE